MTASPAAESGETPAPWCSTCGPGYRPGDEGCRHDTRPASSPPPGETGRPALPSGLTLADLRADLSRPSGSSNYPRADRADLLWLLDAAERAAEYERRINWDTTCKGCADRMDAAAARDLDGDGGLRERIEALAGGYETREQDCRETAESAGWRAAEAWSARAEVYGEVVAALAALSAPSPGATDEGERA